MKPKGDHITIFEHQSLKLGQVYDGVEFLPEHLLSFQKFHGNKNLPYYSLNHKGIQFNEYVGVIQVGSLSVEVLPKADRQGSSKEAWSKSLVGMMLAAGVFDIEAPSSSDLKLKNNFILDLYFELFIKELEGLFHKGLIKKYRKRESNAFALKGSLVFGKHIQKNLVHQERFYVNHSTYDRQHLIHQILLKALLLINRLNNKDALNSRIGNLLLNFPELNNISVNESTFNKIILTRKTNIYKSALSIAKMLLLQFHPDIKSGNQGVLALMFNMNSLWEKFVFKSLRKHKPQGVTVLDQTNRSFWKPNEGRESKMRPDILIKTENKQFVLDTKWKDIYSKGPSPDDLRQLYVYHHYFQAEKVALCYPGEHKINKGNYYAPGKSELSEYECSLITLPVHGNIAVWQKSIAAYVFTNWLDLRCD